MAKLWVPCPKDNSLPSPQSCRAASSMPWSVDFLSFSTPFWGNFRKFVAGGRRYIFGRRSIHQLFTKTCQIETYVVPFSTVLLNPFRSLTSHLNSDGLYKPLHFSWTVPRTTYVGKPIGSMYAIYGNMDPINIPPMWAYIPYMDPMGNVGNAITESRDQILQSRRLPFTDRAYCLTCSNPA
jgi:hypothetical protein